MSEPLVLVDRPAGFVQRLTLTRPEKRNALNNALRAELFAALQAGDADPEIRVTVLRGAGKCFSAGYDLGSNSAEGQPYFTSGGDATLTVWDAEKIQPKRKRGS